MADFEVGDLAWAKMKRYSPWPAMIVEPIKDSKPPKARELSYYVRFFGTHDHSWILASNIFPYEENIDKYAKKNPSGTFKTALEEIVEYAEQHPQSKKSSSPPKANGVASPGKVLQVNNKKLLASKTKSPKSPSIKREKKNESGSLVKKRRTSVSSNISSSSKKEVDKYSPLLDTPPNSRSSNFSSFRWGGSPSEMPKSTGLLGRPPIPPVENAPVDVCKSSEILKRKNIIPTGKVIGFLGLDLIGRGIVSNLIRSFHKVVIWDQTPDKCVPFIELGAAKEQTPGDVIKAAHITFSCLSDSETSKTIFFSRCGVLQAMTTDKGYVEMTSIHPDNSHYIAEAVISKGGRYLEAPILGSRKASEDGTLNILAAGDRNLFDECRSCFEAMGERVFFLGGVGKAAKMNLVINMLTGATYAALGECLSFAQRAGISQKDFLEILNHGPLKCPAIMDNGTYMVESSFSVPNMPLQSMQTNLHMALDVSHQFNQPLPTISAANELYKHAKILGYGLHDVSAIYQGAYF